MKKAFFAAFLALSVFGMEPTVGMIEAVKKGDLAALKAVVTSKEEANAALPNGKNILMLSVWEGKTEIVKYLLKKDADINTADSSGKTPLMLSVWRENLELTKLLVSNGADHKIKNKEGMGAAEIAQLTGNGELIDYINSLK